MQEDTEEKMFKDLLSEYAEPIEDNGFSEFVLATLPTNKKHKRLKSLMVGGAGALGAAIAATQLKGLWSFISSVAIPNNLPSIKTPSVDVNALAQSSLMSSSYAPILLGMVALMVLWVGQVLLFGDNA